jgi:hypothetical protein
MQQQSLDMGTIWMFRISTINRSRGNQIINSIAAESIKIYQHLPIHSQKTIPMWANKLELDGAVVNHAGRPTPLVAG